MKSISLSQQVAETFKFKDLIVTMPVENDINAYLAIKFKLNGYKKLFLRICMYYQYQITINSELKTSPGICQLYQIFAGVTEFNSFRSGNSYTN